jgi:hypothetical protein
MNASIQYFCKELNGSCSKNNPSNTKNENMWDILPGVRNLRTSLESSTYYEYGYQPQVSAELYQVVLNTIQAHGYNLTPRGKLQCMTACRFLPEMAIAVRSEVFDEKNSMKTVKKFGFTTNTPMGFPDIKKLAESWEFWSKLSTDEKNKIIYSLPVVGAGLLVDGR